MQNWMQSVLIDQNGQSSATDPENHINKSSRLTAVRHLGIYRQSYFARLRECMKNQFSALAYALGEELFQMFADQYLEAYPSDSYTLNDLGGKFPDFLEETRPDKEQKEKETWIDFIIELARFEYTLSVIFDGHAAEIKLADETTPDEHLELAPLSQIFHQPYPVCRYYLDVKQKKEPELPFEEESFCAVARKQYRLSLLEIKPAQYYFLERLARGDSISMAKEFCVNNYGFDAKRLDNAWKHWRKSFIAAGFFGTMD